MTVQSASAAFGASVQDSATASSHPLKGTMPPTVKASDVHLLDGTIQALYQDNRASPLYASPRLQAIHLKKLNSVTATSPSAPSDPANDRYRVILSDGVAYMQAMLGLQCNELAASSLLKTNSLLTIKKFTCSMVKDRRILIVLDVDVGSLAHCDTKIGNPANIEELLGVKTASTAQPGAPAAAAATPFPGSSTLPTAAPENAFNPYASRRGDAGAAASLGNATVLTHQRPASGAHSDCKPISSLSPYQNDWTIQARVISKTDVKTWTNARGEGKLFSVTLLDESGEIRLTGFNDACTLFYGLLEVGRVFRISRASVKLARKQFSHVANEYEIHLEKDSMVVPVSERDAGPLPNIKFSFVPLQDLVALQKDDMADVLAVVQELGELSQITSKATQKQLTKRDLTLADASLASIRVTLWGKAAEEASSESVWGRQPVVAIKGAKVSDYNGRTLSVPGAALVQLNPDVPACHELRGWYDSIGQTSTFQNLSAGLAGGSGFGGADENRSGAAGPRMQDRAAIADIKRQGLGDADKADYIDLAANITFLKSDGAMWYAGCPGTSAEGTPCQKKVTEIGPGVYRCEKCARNYDAPSYRYIFSLHVSDMTGQTWLNAFNEAGLLIFQGRTAQDLLDLKETDLPAYQRLVKEATFQRYLFRVRIKNEMYQGESKSRASILSLSKLDYAKETKMLLDWLSTV